MTDKALRTRRGSFDSFADSLAPNDKVPCHPERNEVDPLVILSGAAAAAAQPKDPPRVRQSTVSRCGVGRWSDLRTRWGFFDSLADSFAQNDRVLVGLSFCQSAPRNGVAALRMTKGLEVALFRMTT